MGDLKNEFRAVCGDDLMAYMIAGMDVEPIEGQPGHYMMSGMHVVMDQDACPLPGSQEAAIKRALIDALIDEPPLSEEELRSAEEHETDFWGPAKHAEALGVDSLKGADASGRDMDMARFSGEDLAGTNFSDSKLRGAYAHGADLSGSNFDGANLGAIKLRETQVHPAADITNSTFRGANLSAAEMFRVEASGADFTGATMEYTQMRGIEAEAAIFNGANLNNAMMEHGNFKGAQFEGADLTGATISPYEKGWGRLPVNFEEANFKGATMADLEIQGNMTRASFEGTNLQGTYISGTSFTSMDGSETKYNIGGRDSLIANRLMPYADFTDADLRGAKIESNLRGVNFDGANMEGIDLSGTSHQMLWDFIPALARGDETFGTLHAVDFSNARLKDANLSNTYFESGYGDVRFDGADLRGVNFSGAEFVCRNEVEGITFAGANLQGADLTGVTFRPLGEGSIDFTGADLTGANLSGVDLSRIELTEEQLRSAILSEDTILPAEFEGKIDLPNEPNKEMDSELAPFISEPPPVKPLIPQ